MIQMGAPEALDQTGPVRLLDHSFLGVAGERKETGINPV